MAAENQAAGKRSDAPFAQIGIGTFFAQAAAALTVRLSATT
jgi:hypothetical protein